MYPVLWVGIGGFLGSAARYLISTLVNSHSSTDFPLATFIINVIGCFVIGLVYGFSARELLGGDARLFLATGICGGFTTFSAFSAESLVLMRDGQYLIATLYIVGSVILGIAATMLGFWLSRSVG